MDDTKRALRRADCCGVVLWVLSLLIGMLVISWANRAQGAGPAAWLEVVTSQHTDDGVPIVAEPQHVRCRLWLTATPAAPVAAVRISMDGLAGTYRVYNRWPWQLIQPSTIRVAGDAGTLQPPYADRGMVYVTYAAPGVWLMPSAPYPYGEVLFIRTGAAALPGQHTLYARPLIPTTGYAYPPGSWWEPWHASDVYPTYRPLTVAPLTFEVPS